MLFGQQVPPQVTPLPQHWFAWHVAPGAQQVPAQHCRSLPQVVPSAAVTQLFPLPQTLHWLASHPPMQLPAEQTWQWAHSLSVQQASLARHVVVSAQHLGVSPLQQLVPQLVPPVAMQQSVPTRQLPSQQIAFGPQSMSPQHVAQVLLRQSFSPFGQAQW